MTISALSLAFVRNADELDFRFQGELVARRRDYVLGSKDIYENACVVLFNYSVSKHATFHSRAHRRLIQRKRIGTSFPYQVLLAECGKCRMKKKERRDEKDGIRMTDEP